VDTRYSDYNIQGCKIQKTTIIILTSSTTNSLTTDTDQIRNALRVFKYGAGEKWR
jgi:hypothetical protein